MERRNNDPGAVQYGNFMNYYQIRSPAERVKLLPKREIWIPTEEDADSRHPEQEPYLVLDVGCNSGDFTQLLHQFLEEQLQRPVHVLGIDIDGRLIERAVEANTLNPDKIRFLTADVMNEPEFDGHVDAYLREYNREKFDAICCYSITMWIHINHHDEGLRFFLRKLSKMSRLFVVEPQPFKCYKNAEHRLKKAGEVFPLFPELKWRYNVEQNIQDYLVQELGLKSIFESEPTKWQRRICFYR